MLAVDAGGRRKRTALDLNLRVVMLFVRVNVYGIGR